MKIYIFTTGWAFIVSGQRVVTVLFYFFFSVEHRGIGRGVSRVGIYFLMVSFGAAFGYTVMARMSLLIGRFDDLLLYSSRSYGHVTRDILLFIGRITKER